MGSNVKKVSVDHSMKPDAPGDPLILMSLLEKTAFQKGFDRCPD